MNKKNIIVALLFTASCASSVYADGASNGVSQAQLRDILYNIRTDAKLWAQLCLNSGSCLETPTTTIPWTRILNATHFSAQMGIDENQARANRAIQYIALTAPVGGSGRGPTITYNASPENTIHCLLFTPSGLKLSPTVVGTGDHLVTTNAFQLTGGGSGVYSDRSIFGTGGDAPGGHFNLLCVNLKNNEPAPADSGALGVNWGGY